MCALCTVRGEGLCSCSRATAVRQRYLLTSLRSDLFLLQPFDEDYLNHLDPPVKHMSFHAYLRKLTGGADK